MGIDSLPQSDHVVAYWKLDESSGTLYDDVGSWNLTPSGSPTYLQSGKVDHSLYFNGGNQKLENGSFNATGTTGTVCGWIKKYFKSGESFHTLASIRNTRPLLYVPNVDKCQAYWCDASGGDGPGGNYMVGGPIIGDNVWFHMALAWSPSNTRLFGQGACVRSLAWSLPAPSSNHVRIAQYWNDAGVTTKGYIDEVIIWNVKLTDAEVLSVKNLEYIGDESKAFLMGG